MPYATSDICDAHLDAINVIRLPLRHYGGKKSFFGRVMLVELYDDNRILFDLLRERNDKQVLVVRVLSQDNPAVVGESVARMAIENGWSGMIVEGNLRDSGVLNTLNIGVMALAGC